MALRLDRRRARRRPGAGGGRRRAWRSDDRVLLDRFSRPGPRGATSSGSSGPNGAGKSTLLRAIVGERAAGRRRASGCRTRCGSPTTGRTWRRCRPTDRSTSIIADLRPAWGRGADPGPPRPLRLLRRLGAAPGRHALGRRARAGGAGHDDAVRRQLPHLRRADQPPRRRVDRGAGGRHRGLRRHRAAREPRSRAAPRAHDPGLGAARARASPTIPAASRSGRRPARSGPTPRRSRPREEEALRRVQERKQTRRPDDDRQQQQSARRTAERAVAEAEARVAEWEARVAALRAQLEDPALYVTPDGAARGRARSAPSWRPPAELDRAFAAVGSRHAARWRRPAERRARALARPRPAGGGRSARHVALVLGERRVGPVPRAVGTEPSPRPGGSPRPCSSASWPGTAVAAVLNLADLLPARCVLRRSRRCSAPAANAGWLAAPGASAGALVFRFLTGFFLAGVYPPAMKMAATWFRTDRGLAIGSSSPRSRWGRRCRISSAPPTSARFADRRAARLRRRGAGSAVLVAAGYRDGPHQFPRRPFSWRLVATVARHRETRLATAGYLGHMWELYAMWTWVPAFLAASAAARAAAGHPVPASRVYLAAFGAIAAGGAGARLGRVGRAPVWGTPRVVTMAMAASGLCSLAIGSVLRDEPALAGRAVRAAVGILRGRRFGPVQRHGHRSCAAARRRHRAHAADFARLPAHHGHDSAGAGARGRVGLAAGLRGARPRARRRGSRRSAIGPAAARLGRARPLHEPAVPASNYLRHLSVAPVYSPAMNVRDQLLAAAARVYAEAGYRGATTRRIALAAGVNEITLFRHFGSKDALLREAIARCGPAERCVACPSAEQSDARSSPTWRRATSGPTCGSAGR